MSEVLALDDLAKATDQAVAALQAGKLVVLPTDTVYAVVADAFDAGATGRLYAAKQRQQREPLAVVIRSQRQVVGLVEEIPEAADRLMASYWPGPLTLVFRATEGLGWSLGDMRGTVGLRMPTDELLLAVTAQIGPLACTAANRRGDPAPTTVAQARVQLGDEVALYVDGGERDGDWSTIVDVTGDQPRVLREGAVPGAHVRRVASGEIGWGATPEEEPADDLGLRDEPNPSEPAAIEPDPSEPAAGRATRGSHRATEQDIRGDGA